jgi:heme exporter protein D
MIDLVLTICLEVTYLQLIILVLYSLRHLKHFLTTISTERTKQKHQNGRTTVQNKEQIQMKRERTGKNNAKKASKKRINTREMHACGI